MHKYSVLPFTSFTSSTLLIEKYTFENSFVLSFAPDRDIAEFIIVAQLVLWIDTLLCGLSIVP